MDQDQLVENFFRSLRVTLTNAFSYPKDHPYFVKSVENFKLKLDEIFIVLNPFKFGVTSLGLMVDGKDLTRVGFYDELARLLHQRKIKSIEIRSGVTLGELVCFFSLISMSQKDIFKNGGINALPEKKQLINFTIEELDYSAFLQGDGQECVDIWGFMLKEAVQNNDEAKLNKLADNFGSFIKRAAQNEVFETEGVSSSINEFLVCLKEKNREKFDQCAKDVFLWLLSHKGALNDESLARLKPVFDGLNQEDFTTLLWEGLSQEDNFDTLSLQLFSKISDQKNLPKITEGFSNKIKALQNSTANPKVTRKIQDLLAETQGVQLSAVYRNTLESLIKGISSSGVLFFDQKTLKENYRYIVLNMFSTDEEQENLLLAAEALEKELPSIFEDNDYAFLNDLWQQLAKRKNEKISIAVDLEQKFSSFIENIVLNQTLLPKQECFLKMITSSSQEPAFYLDKIFMPQKVNSQVLGLFIKFFPAELNNFYQRVEQKIKDIDFLSSLIEALGQLDSSAIPEIFEHIYFTAPDLIKAEILKVMRRINKVDANFILKQLTTNSVFLKKNLLSVLVLDAQAIENALDYLFKVSSFCGTKNGLLIENMEVVFDLRISQAISRIEDLSKRRFFWNQELRNRAEKILKEWNVN